MILFQVYYSEEVQELTVEAIRGKCEVRKKSDVPTSDSPALFQHIFYCERLYDPIKGSLKQVNVSLCLLAFFLRIFR